MTETDQVGGQEDRILTPQQQAMWRMENRGEFRGKPKEDRKAFNKNFRAQLQAMSEDERTTLRNGLQAKWDALPVAEKLKLEQKINERQAGGAKGKGKPEGRGQGKGKGKGKGAGKGKGRAGGVE